LENQSNNVLNSSHKRTDLTQAVYAAAAEQASSRVYWATQTTNTSGRALCDKLAKHAGVIVYSSEL
jgi:hypothetical protein